MKLDDICSVIIALLIITLLSLLSYKLVKLKQPGPPPEIGQSAIELGDFEGDGYKLLNMTTEYGTCWDKQDVCIRLAYTLLCEKKKCRAENLDIFTDSIKIKAKRNDISLWYYGWFNSHELADNRELKQGKSHTEMVVFKLDKPEPGGVTITVDGQTVYQD